jgi:hypothetical protein
LLRVAAILLIVFAIARPVFWGRERGRVRIVLIDGSLSMKASSRVQPAKEKARNIVSKLEANERAAILVLSAARE